MEIPTGIWLRICALLHTLIKWLIRSTLGTLQYDQNIDNSIIRELDKRITCSYRELTRLIEKRLGRRLSPDVFNLHIGNLTRAKILNRQPAPRRGKKVLYSLTDVAKKQVQLKMIAHPKHSIFRKIFQKFFFYEVHYSPRKVISTEKEFDKFLSELNIPREKLRCGLWSEVGTSDVIAREIYRVDGMSARSRKYHNAQMKEYWLMKEEQSKVVEDINFICSLKQNNVNIAITKIERWEINKNSSHKKFRTNYVYELPGVSMEEFMNNEWLRTRFKLTDVKEAFNLLQKNHLAEIALIVHNQIRFRLTDNVLRNFIEAIRDIHLAEYRFLMYKWQYFDAPSHEELKRWILLMGEEVASKFFKNMEIERRKYKKMKDDCKSIEEFIENLDKDTLLINGEPDKDTLYFGWHDEFEIYGRQRKTEPATPKTEIEDFEMYRRGRLEHHLEFLPANLEDEGIEEVKMMFKDIIERYPFLHDVMRIVCPYVFEPANIDMQAKIIDDKISKDVGTELLARRLRAVNLS
jgi:hypothetical protein